MAKQKTPKKIKKEFKEEPELKVLAEKVIDEQKLDVFPAKIIYLTVYPHVSKTTAGRCIRANNELKHFSKHDYIIEMSGDLWDALDESTQYILMHHELLHVLPTMNEKTGEWEYKIRDHDVQDFSKII